jgi:hypothetical protein
MKNFYEPASSKVARQNLKKILDEPTMKFGYPKLDEDDDSDDEPDLSFLQNLGPKNPFDAISANLYN